jgi:DNA polymerase-4
LQRKNMMAADYRHIGGLENRLGRHYNRFAPFQPAASLADQSLALRKSQNAGSNRRSWVKGQTLEFLRQHFGKAGSYYYWAARGIDERPVRADRIRKSIGAENTFASDLFTYEAARDALREIVDKVWRYCEGAGIRGRTVTLKVKFANFQIITRSRTGQMPIRTRSELEEVGDALLEPLFPVSRGIRLIGISMSSLAAEQAEQPEFSLPV